MTHPEDIAALVERLADTIEDACAGCDPRNKEAFREAARACWAVVSKHQGWRPIPYAKRERRHDDRGEMVWMAECDGYVMARRPGFLPFVKTKKEWAALPSAEEEG